jgi:hypothetical protein
VCALSQWWVKLAQEMASFIVKKIFGYYITLSISNYRSNYSSTNVANVETISPQDRTLLPLEFIITLTALCVLPVELLCLEDASLKEMESLIVCIIKKLKENKNGKYFTHLNCT